MRKPRLLYYNDARHYSFYRYDPPMSLHQLRQPVDEVLGTGVDTLVYGLASGQTFLHDSQVGARWGEGMVEHNHGVMWWRAAENLEQAIAAGHDPLRVVVERAHQKGLQVLCSLRLNDPSTADNRYMLNRLKQEHPEVVIGEEDPGNPHAATCMDFAREEVRRERLAIIEEVCGRYGADGIELDQYVRVFFKPSQARRNAPVLTDFARQVRALLDRIGKERGESLCLAARVHPVEEENLAVGMDVRAWISEGLVDLVVPQPPGALFDPEPPVGWLVEAARRAGAWVFLPPGRTPYDDRHHAPTIEMYRAALANARALGADGLYLADLEWPPGPPDYQALRELGDPDIIARKDKHYFPARQEPHAPGPRPLPVRLEQDTRALVPFLVGDELEAARRDNELEGAALAVRVVQYCPRDELRFRFNGQAIAPARTRHFYGGLVAYGAWRAGLPPRIDTHYWFEFDLPLDLVREGRNEVEVHLARRFAPLAAERVLHQVELRLTYRQPPRPAGGQM
jgi:hypothetical protein